MIRLGSTLIRRWLPKRPTDAHKGTFGSALVVAGSRGMAGAALLCAEAVLRAGAGKVTIAHPKGLERAIAARLPEAMTLPLPATREGTLGLSAVNQILRAARSQQAACIGPGLGRSWAVRKSVQKLVDHLTVPLVLDADGLFAIVNNTEVLLRSGGRGILTPHEGEMARLLGVSVARVHRSRAPFAVQFARAHRTCVVLKGPRTLIASPDGRVAQNTTGNVALATGGTGDVLAGIITAFLSQGLDPWKAACCGVYLHGLAADIGARRKGKRGWKAGDLFEYLPDAFRKVERGK